MSSYHEAVKRFLTEVSKFVNGTLRSEILSLPAQKERDKLEKRLQKLFADYSSLAPSSGDEGSTSSAKDGGTSGSQDESRNTTESGQGSEEDSYADNIPFTTVKALTGAAKIGYLERKQKDLLFTTWQKRYCVLHKNILYIFKKPGDKKQQGAFYVTGYEVREAPQNVKETAKKEGSFEMVSPGKKSYQFVADGKDDLLAWKEAIEKAGGETVGTENGEEEDGDLYEDLAEPSFNQSTNTSLSVSPSPASSSPAAPVGGGEVEDFYTDGESLPANSTPLKSATSPPGHKPGAVPPPRIDQNQNVKKEVVDDEFEDDGMLYEPLDAVEPPAPPKNSSTPVGKSAGGITSAAAAPPLPPHMPVGTDTPSVPPPLPSRGDACPPPPLPGRSVPLPPPPTEPLPAIPQPKNSPALGKILHPAEDFENMFYGMWPCKGTTDNELTFERGQIVHVISRDLDKDNWWIGELDGKIGLVPKSYLTPAFEVVG